MAEDLNLVSSGDWLDYVSFRSGNQAWWITEVEAEHLPTCDLACDPECPIGIGWTCTVPSFDLLSIGDRVELLGQEHTVVGFTTGSPSQGKPSTMTTMVLRPFAWDDAGDQLHLFPERWAIERLDVSGAVRLRRLAKVEGGGDYTLADLLVWPDLAARPDRIWPAL